MQLLKLEVPTLVKSDAVHLSLRVDTSEEPKITVEEVTEPSEVNEPNVKEDTLKEVSQKSISPKLLKLNHAQARLSKFHLNQL